LLQLLNPFPLAPHHHHHRHHSREKKKKQHHCPKCRKPLALGLAVAELGFVRRAAVLHSLLFCFVLFVCFFCCRKVYGDDSGCCLSGDLLKDQFGLFLVEWRWGRRGGTEGRRFVCLRGRWSSFCRTRRTDLWQGQWRRGT